MHSRGIRLVGHGHTYYTPLCAIYVREEQYKTEIAISKEKPRASRLPWKNPYVYTPLGPPIDWLCLPEEYKRGY